MLFNNPKEIFIELLRCISFIRNTYSIGLGTIGLGVILLIRGRGNGSDQSRTNRRNDSLSGSTGSNGTTPTKYDVYQSNNSTLSRDRSGHEGEHFAMQRSSKLLIRS